MMSRDASRLEAVRQDRLQTCFNELRTNAAQLSPHKMEEYSQLIDQLATDQLHFPPIDSSIVTRLPYISEVSSVRFWQLNPETTR